MSDRDLVSWTNLWQMVAIIVVVVGSTWAFMLKLSTDINQIKIDEAVQRSDIAYIKEAIRQDKVLTQRTP